MTDRNDSTTREAILLRAIHNLAQFADGASIESVRLYCLATLHTLDHLPTLTDGGH